MLCLGKNALGERGADFIFALARRTGVGRTALELAFSPSGQDYAFFDWADLGSTFQGTDTSTPATANGDNIGRWESRGKGTFTGLQASVGFRPKRQATGTTGDAGDDGLLSNWNAAAGNNCIMVRAKIPDSVPATQIIAGSYSGSSRFWIGVDSAGALRRGIGASSTTAGSGDLRGQTITAAIVCTGANYRVFLNTVDIQTGAQSDGPATAYPYSICCANNGGSLANFSSVGILKLAFGHVAPSQAELAAIAAEWAA